MGRYRKKINIEEEQIVWKGNLDIRGTSVKKIKAKRIGGSVDAEGVENLEDIEIEKEIGCYLDIEGINENFQLNIINKIKNGELEVRGRIYLG